MSDPNSETSKAKNGNRKKELLPLIYTGQKIKADVLSVGFFCENKNNANTMKTDLIRVLFFVCVQKGVQFSGF